MVFVEDEPDEADFLRLAVEQTHLPIRVVTVPDPSACMEHLRQRSPIAEMILLDMDRPDMDCPRFLNELKAMPELRHVPVLAMTSFDDLDKVHEVYLEHAAACIRKPMDLSEYRTLVRSFHAFWFDWAVLCVQAQV